MNGFYIQIIKLNITPCVGFRKHICSIGTDSRKCHIAISVSAIGNFRHFILTDIGTNHLSVEFHAQVDPLVQPEAGNCSGCQRDKYSGIFFIIFIQRRIFA